jgi:hypothetical protein
LHDDRCTAVPSQVRQAHPVLPEKKHEFCYLILAEAMMYLNRKIEQDRIPEVTKTLRAIRKRILAQTK